MEKFGERVVKERGHLIRDMLSAKGLRPRDIERRSRTICDEKGNQEFFVSHATLADIEAGSTPSIYKLYTLAVCCGVSYSRMLLLFGVYTGEAEPQALALVPDKPAPETSILTKPNFEFRMNFDVRVDREETNLLQGEPQDWRFLPQDLVTRLEPTRFLYALIGLKDESMSDIIPPGSLVEIDREQTQIDHTGWNNLRDRPIYLVWHEQGYSCGWCQIVRNELLIMPWPGSARPILLFKVPREATVIGRIVHVWCSLCPESRMSARLERNRSFSR